MLLCEVGYQSRLSLAICQLHLDEILIELASFGWPPQIRLICLQQILLNLSLLIDNFPSLLQFLAFLLQLLEQLIFFLLNIPQPLFSPPIHLLLQLLHLALLSITDAPSLLLQHEGDVD